MYRCGVAQAWAARPRPDEKAGRLVRVLPDWSGGFVPDVRLVTGSSQLPVRVRLFMDHILARIFK